MKLTRRRSAEMQIPRTSLHRWIKNAYKQASRRTWRLIQLCMENDGAHTETLDVQQSHAYAQIRFFLHITIPKY
ncbi:hypothetical protein C0J52_26536 [Blattella germanica]|nr:hypothetical protein C0J52_26536 [Blattella germanica]